jgi:hypothetical protein
MLEDINIYGNSTMDGPVKAARSQMTARRLVHGLPMKKREPSKDL